MPEPDRRPPRFPFVAALLCAACLGAAAWTWMRYSYAWTISADDIVAIQVAPLGCDGDGYLVGHWCDGWYVSISRDEYRRWVTEDEAFWQAWLTDEKRRFPPPRPRMIVRASDENHHSLYGSEQDWPVPMVKGRADLGYYLDSSDCRIHYLGVRVSDSRFTGASIAGLVVGAMGVFVFAVALRHWLGEHRTAA